LFLKFLSPTRQALVQHGQTVEAMLRLLAAELGPFGVRTVCLHSAGSEGAADKTLAQRNPELGKRAEGWGQRWMSRNLMGKAPTLEEVGNMAAFYGLRSSRRNDWNYSKPERRMTSH
jgi:NAD(P)-dependent dehydrogenase (short-subunit alcohol dehydrogenase family)